MSEFVAPVFDHLICAPSEKAALEAKNTALQLQYIDHLVNERGQTELRESHVLELQELAIQDIYPCAGRYRGAIHDVRIQESKHTIPEAAAVQSYVREAVDCINNERASKSAIHRAAYSLWRFNWIHPFPGGNGRTARALTYLIVCMDNGATLPGEPTMPRIIAESSRDEYLEALQAADAADLKGEINLRPMKHLLNRVLAQQLANALTKLAFDLDSDRPPPPK